MARINVEDSLWSDPRFMDLCLLLGDKFKALGVILVAWKMAQKHWCPDRAPIPAHEWFSAGLGKEMTKVGLAREAQGGIYICGSEEHFAWWFQRQEAGKKSAISRKKNSGTAQPKSPNTVRTPFGDSPNGPERPFEDSRTSSSSSFSSYIDPSKTFLEEVVPNNPESEPVELTPSGFSSPPLPKELVDQNLVEFFSRAGVRPKNVMLWLKTYEDPVWLRLEIYKTIAWLDANPKKRPKSNYTRFIGSWLGRGWEWHRKHLTSNPVAQKTKWDRVFGDEVAG